MSDTHDLGPLLPDDATERARAQHTPPRPFVTAAPGTRIHIVFKAQPFSVQPNPRTMEMDVRFNTQSGIVHSYDEEAATFTFTSGSLRWTFRQEDILGWADADRKALD